MEIFEFLHLMRESKWLLRLTKVSAKVRCPRRPGGVEPRDGNDKIYLFLSYFNTALATIELGATERNFIVRLTIFCF